MAIYDFNNPMGLLGVNNNPTGSLGLNISPTLDARAKQAEEDEAKRKRAEQSLKLQNLADTLRMVNANKSGNTQGVAFYSNRLSDRRAAEQARLKKLADQKKRDDFYNSLNANQKMIFDMKEGGMPDSYIKSQFYPTINSSERRIVKGADGFNYYADTGKRVLPGVVTNPETSKRTTIKGADGFNYFVDTGERVLPGVVKNEKATDRRYEKAADGFYRYVDDGTKVFGDVEIVDPNFIKPTEDNPMGLSKKEIFDRSDKLSDDFRAGSKDFIVSRDSMKRILDAANDPSPFGDLSIIFSAMKVLDPNSVVRESEFKTVADAAPLLERLGFSKNKIEAIQAGNKLTNQQRADVVGTVLDFYKSAVISQKSLEEYYANRAIRSGLKPEDVIFDYGATVVPKIQDFEFIVSLQNMSIDQLKNIDRSKFTDKQKEIFLKELKNRN